MAEGEFVVLRVVSQIPEQVNASEVDVRITLDGQDRRVRLDVRTTLLDALRERLGNTSAKKGCDHGHCGSCTVLVDDRRVLSCLLLAVAVDGAAVRTADGLANGDDLHPLQRAFIEHDALQCGYCTPGQIMSAVGMLQEVDAGFPSAVTELHTSPTAASDDEIRERMSGNLCRCGAYVNIVQAIAQVARR